MMSAANQVRFWNLSTTTKIKDTIFGNLNYTDLKNCRLVAASWNDYIVSSSFFKSRIFYVSLGPNSQGILNSTKVHWSHFRFELFEASHCPESFWTPSSKNPFSNVRALEFKQCFISWHLFKKVLTLTPHLQSLLFNRSIFKDAEIHPHPATLALTPKEHQAFLQRISRLQALTVTDAGEVTGLVEILDKMLLYGAKNLTTLKVEYRAGQCLRNDDAVRFLQVLSELILGNRSTLRNLILNIRNTEILNNFLPFVLMPMEAVAQAFQLHVFKLAQPLPEGDNASISVDASRFLVHFGDFLRTQRSLQSLAFPNLMNLGAAESRRWSVLDHTTKHLEKLRVPGAMYLRRNMLKTFHNLKVLFIGEKNLGNASTFLQPTKFVVDRGGMAKRNGAKMETLSIYAATVYESGNLFHILEKFPNLTKFEFNGLRPILNDKDIQALIKYAPALRHLSIVHCDLVTDKGLTGIPLDTCHDMLRYSTVYIDDIKATKRLGTAGSPLSNLTQLVSLQLVGTAQFTDVGIKFGLEFQDMRKIQLPFCKRITSWGIEQLGFQNPCLESLILSGATEETAIGLAKVAANHNRLVKEQCKVQTIRKVDGDMIHPTLLHGIIWNNSN